jgi:4-amino-4-deoxy-L-arabinose transferase-like glycosyltransferase
MPTIDKTRLEIALQASPVWRGLKRNIAQFNGRPIPVQKIQASIMVACIALASLLRVLAIGALGFNSDEAVYAGQAAAIANVPVLNEMFPIFRAHPLLYQFMLALAFQISVSDVLARIVAAVIGVITIFVVYRLGKTLYDPWVGILAAFLMAVMPYHVVVSRQVLLDGPMTLFATLTLYFIVRYAEAERPTWLYAAGATMGLTLLTKETAIVFIGSIFIFMAISPKVHVRGRDLAIATASMALIFAAFPLSLALAGGGGSQRTQQYLIWQLLRRPNHTWEFYLENVIPAVGVMLILVATLGLVWLRKKWSWRETLLVSWIIVPVIFFQLWPTKGFQYLLPITPALAVLAGRTIRAGSWSTPICDWTNSRIIIEFP